MNTCQNHDKTFTVILKYFADSDNKSVTFKKDDFISQC